MAGLRLLLALDRLRLRGFFRYPSAGAVAGVALPLLMAVGLLWSIGRTGAATMADGDAAVLTAMLVSGPVAFLAYGALFRWADASFVRRLGFDPGANYRERSMRHLGQAVVIALLALIPFVSAGGTVAGAAVVTLTAALATWGIGCAMTARAALSMSRQSPGAGWGCLMAGIWDREVAEAAPLAYSPLPGFLAGTVAGAAAFANPWTIAVTALVAAGAGHAGAAWYVRALPTFGPQALEMAFTPAPRGEGVRLPIGRGIGRLLPHRVAAAWTRDAVVAARRFPWATRVAWPVAIGGFFALARWGESPATRSAVMAMTLLALLAQALAGIALGAMEADGRRWIDRSAGIGRLARFAGRWGWGWGLSLWMTVPVALAWTWWTGAGAGWAFLAAGGVTAALAATASSIAAGR